ncbi:MAG: hypothetical protein MJY71_02455 [Bacteroidaceae bacterium]|nr:hypothetical protein [Bacteroidaceae bacterium]
MIIQNGTIQVQCSDGGGLDSAGYPTSAVQTWGAPIPCQFIPTKHNALAQRTGEPVTEQSYTILVEAQARPFRANRVRLMQFGHVLGEFSVVSIELLEAVGEVRIIV